ncbi:hypothetical protein H1R82_11205 [Thermoactinomyces intermedius]|uniref:Uncharacterized protein n=1 Tax=Thermoactinomyces intermedius TaxID=2024 RepID=A0A8I1DFE9_THEIN|nr:MULTISPECIES: hypothetical protein [Thermoactinomyces]MBA4549545.1 hypothetical protein [Thermoactinomyces intermedius]MBA4837195.1 hypothetical protein [Thermoactinomyces intermedius]MBH8596024.1 hypothetical protein [Thermoactinomyces intermedius]MBH8602166.1 hypothetical protein [Thermoactinomyces sp. CICC 23799]
MILIYAVLSTVFLFGAITLGKKLGWEPKSAYILASILDGVLIIIFIILYLI